MDRNTRELYRLLDREGFQVVDAKRNGVNHHKLTVAKDGRQAIIIAPRDFGDPRSRSNFITQLRRLIRLD